MTTVSPQIPTQRRCKQVSDTRLSKILNAINRAKGRNLTTISNAVQLRCLEQNSPDFQFSQIPLTNVLRFIASANKTEMQQITAITNQRRAQL